MFQRGCLKKENRKKGPTWVLRFYVTRKSDGKRVEHKAVVGLVHDFKTENSAWAEVERLHLHQQINQSGIPTGKILFENLTAHYLENELSESTESVAKLASTTMDTYRLIINKYLHPRWGRRIALGIEPLEIEKWLQSLKRDEGLANPTCDKIRRVMSLVYKHGQRYGLIPRSDEVNPMRFVRCKTTSDYEALILQPKEAFALVMGLEEPERTLTLLASGTGLRISECLGLQWQDIDFDGQKIYVRRTWLQNRIGEPKSKASAAPVPMHSLLADFMLGWMQQTVYGQPTDWVFASKRLKGKKPRVGNMLVEDHLRPAAVRAGILAEDDLRRFGFHNLRHSLASFLVRSKTDVKAVQNILRHADVKTTLGIYTHSMAEDRLAAQGEALAAILHQPSIQAGQAN
jgi:integrase